MIVVGGQMAHLLRTPVSSKRILISMDKTYAVIRPAPPPGYVCMGDVMLAADIPQNKRSDFTNQLKW